MAPEEVGQRSRRSDRNRARAKSETRRTDTERNETSAANPSADNPEDLDALRKARLKYQETPPEDRRKKMKYVGETVIKIPVDVRYVRKASSVQKQRKTTDPEPQHRQRKDREVENGREDDSDTEYVYGRPEVGQRDDRGDVRTRVSSATAESSVRQRSRTRRTASSRVVRMVDERRTPPRRQTEPVRRRNSDAIDECDARPREMARPTLRKSVTSAREPPRPTLKRSATSGKAKTDVSSARTKPDSEHSRKGSGVLSNFLRPIPEKKISCLTCGSDEVPISRSAKLACSHRMCHTCLRRIFTMSVTDPAHMPPRCCTAEHIPLKHVDKLFDQAFKKTWNRKFQEYNTQDRIYCPARGCGEWIKPNHISVEHGRKVGKCKRCNTRVCCMCNNKMHVSRECPKDPATKQFVEVAKEKGWQRCFSCSAMVELKEGCNHMTCRCTAEFCMVCGSKWKSCDCPWFNYEQVDAHLGNPARYQEELDRRRDQEHRDAAIARRMEVLGLDEEDGMMLGIGNAAGHHLNQNFIQQAREALTANYQQAGQAARGLLNGLMTGRENRIPGMPLPENQTAQQLRHGHHAAADPAEAPAAVAAANPVAAAAPEHGRDRRPIRRVTIRRQSAMADMFAGRSQTTAERVQERRVQDWAQGIRHAS